MPHLLSLPPLVEGFDSSLLAQQAAGFLDLIGLGALAFACSHIIDSFILDLRLVSDDLALLIMQGTVLLSMLFFVPGLAALADMLPTLPKAKGVAALPRFWPFAVTVVMMTSAFSFILYGITPEAETIAFFGLDGSIIVMIGLCMLLLVRARIGGMIGRYLWLAMLAMLIFSLAHPAQVWLYDNSGLPADLLDILHRLIVMPALLLFAFSLTRLSRRLNANLYLEAQQDTLVSVATQRPKYEQPRRITSARDRAYQHMRREQAMRSPTGSRPFPALRQRASID